MVWPIDIAQSCWNKGVGAAAAENHANAAQHLEVPALPLSTLRTPVYDACRRLDAVNGPAEASRTSVRVAMVVLGRQQMMVTARCATARCCRRHAAYPSSSRVEYDHLRLFKLSQTCYRPRQLVVRAAHPVASSLNVFIAYGGRPLLQPCLRERM